MVQYLDAFTQIKIDRDFFCSKLQIRLSYLGIKEYAKRSAYIKAFKKIKQGWRQKMKAIGQQNSTN